MTSKMAASFTNSKKLRANDLAVVIASCLDNGDPDDSTAGRVLDNLVDMLYECPAECVWITNKPDPDSETKSIAETGLQNFDFKSLIKENEVCANSDICSETFTAYLI